MKHKKKISNRLENFDDLFVGEPKNIEKNLKKLLPQAKCMEDKSIYLQILSQIAFAQALQKKIKLAHKTLDEAERYLANEYPIAQARILFERGRIFYQSDNIKSALPLFLKSYRFSKKHKLDEHASSAAHLLAFVEKNINDKIKWNKIAIDIGKKSKEKKPREWLAIEYLNLGYHYIQAKKYKQALKAYKTSEKLAKQYGFKTLRARLGIAQSLRLLNQIDKALSIQLILLKEYNTLAKKRGLPIALLQIERGQVFEELSEIYLTKAKIFSCAAYQGLSKDAWFIKLEPKRIERLNWLRNI